MFTGHEANTADPQVVFFARTIRTYVIVTRAFLENLFSSFSLPLPDVFKTPEVPLLGPNEKLPSGVSEEEVVYAGALILCAGISMC